MLAQVREALPEFERIGVRLGCVVQAGAEEAARFCAGHGVEGICVADPSRESYRALGLGRTSWGRILFARADLKQRRGEASRAGHRVSLRGTFQKHSDVLQLPGAALVAKGGRLLWLHRGTHPGDLPSARQLLEIATRHLAAQP